jgi:DNA-binding PadR family transcriptional regulator
MFDSDEMYGGRPGPAFGWAGAGPWQAEWGTGPRGWYGEFRGPRLRHMLRHMMRRGGPFGFGGPPRMFGRGDMKYALLDLLRERPKHGYEMIKELEDRSGGFYTPSAGAIYPTLELLEDRGWVSVETVEGKKVYSITDAGRQALSEHQERAGGPGPFAGPRGWGHHGHGPGGPFGGRARPELRALAHQSREVVQLMRVAVMSSGGDPERLARLRAIVERTRGDLLGFLNETQGGHPQGTPEPGPASDSGPVQQL